LTQTALALTSLSDVSDESRVLRARRITRTGLSNKIDPGSALAALRGCHAFRHEPAFKANQIFRNRCTSLAIFPHPLLNQSDAASWIVFRLFHLRDQFDEFRSSLATHLLRHQSQVSRCPRLRLPLSEELCMRF
jgi:hypothetical protein